MMRTPLLHVMCSLLLATGCAGPSVMAPPAADTTPDQLLDQRRKLAHSGYDAQPAATVVDGVQVRVSDLDMADALVRGRVQRPRTEVRVPLQNLWRLQADKAAHRATVDGDVAQVDLDASEHSAARCLEAVDATSASLDLEAWEQLRFDLALVQSWLDDLRDQSLISDPEHRVRSLALQNALLKSQPKPAPMSGLTGGTLPGLSSPGGRLDLTPERLERALVAHPLWARMDAEQARLSSLAQRETSKRLPWLAWISMGYTPRFAGERPVVEGRFAVEIPLGLDAARKADTLALRAASVRLEGQSLLLQQAELLRGALEQWTAWEDTVGALAQADAAAREHRQLALTWIEARSARPGDAQSLLRDAFEIRRSVRASQTRAGICACQVQALGGTHPTLWPRTP
mgnify:CR=1 FL=1